MEWNSQNGSLLPIPTYYSRSVNLWKVKILENSLEPQLEEEKYMREVWLQPPGAASLCHIPWHIPGAPTNLYKLHLGWVPGNSSLKGELTKDLPWDFCFFHALFLKAKPTRCTTVRSYWFFTTDIALLSYANEKCYAGVHCFISQNCLAPYPWKHYEERFTYTNALLL